MDQPIAGFEVGNADGKVTLAIKFAPDQAGRQQIVTLSVDPTQAASLGGSMIANAGAMMVAKSPLQERGFLVPAGTNGV